MTCILLGIVCLCFSVGFIVHNHLDAKKAEEASRQMLTSVQEQIAETSQEEMEEVFPQEMAVTQVDGYDCIGILSIPVLELELPVLTDWNYTKLRTAPCLYHGTYYEKDFVIAAHNYQSHFGRLPELLPGDLVLFTDVSGKVRCYEVVVLETLPGNAVDQMINSGFDLSLYTCTPGGANRVTVRCSTAV